MATELQAGDRVILNKYDREWASPGGKPYTGTVRDAYIAINTGDHYVYVFWSDNSIYTTERASMVTLIERPEKRYVRTIRRSK
jgi:hypothetical protein